MDSGLQEQGELACAWNEITSSTKQKFLDKYDKPSQFIDNYQLTKKKRKKEKDALWVAGMCSK